MNDTTHMGIMKGLERTSAKYPVDKLECKSFTIAPSFHSITEDHFFQDKIPSRAILLLIDDEAFQGSYSSNPFNFKHMFVNEIGLIVNGQPMPYAEPLKLKFNENGTGEHIRGILCTSHRY